MSSLRRPVAAEVSTVLDCLISLVSIYGSVCSDSFLLFLRQAKKCSATKPLLPNQKPIFHPTSLTSPPRHHAHLLQALLLFFRDSSDPCIDAGGGEPRPELRSCGDSRHPKTLETLKPPSGNPEISILSPDRKLRRLRSWRRHSMEGDKTSTGV